MNGEALTKQVLETAEWFVINSTSLVKEQISSVEDIRSSGTVAKMSALSSVSRINITFHQTRPEEEPIHLNTIPKLFRLDWTCVSKMNGSRSAIC